MSRLRCSTEEEAENDEGVAVARAQLTRDERKLGPGLAAAERAATSGIGKKPPSFRFPRLLAPCMCLRVGLVGCGCEARLDCLRPKVMEVADGWDGRNQKGNELNCSRTCWKSRFMLELS